MNNTLTKRYHKVDFCVVGGGLAGLCAAVAAARHGAKVALMHDRAMFGGNASSEVRMWISGARGDNNRGTGILEEIALENIYRNPYRVYPIWDGVLYNIVRNEKNITYILNCSANDVEMDGDRIKCVMGWQSTTQQWHIVEADYFADCSGDSILAPLSGAEFRQGREASNEFNESMAPKTADKCTMGNTCLMQARQMNNERKFIPFEWGVKFDDDELRRNRRNPDIDFRYENFWYLELGGDRDILNDAEDIRDDLLSVSYGMWDYVKNSGKCDGNPANWELDFIGYLPGKRESRRYVGDYIMNQNDVMDGGRFDDIVAYGGWALDDHNPAGIANMNVEPNVFSEEAPSPFGIPYRVLYSKNIDNLYFAGRNISMSHIGLSATRVMETCALVGQAVGVAASIAVKEAISPREVGKNHINKLKQQLMEDDCYLPYNRMEMSDITKESKISSEGSWTEKLINGIERKINGKDNAWEGNIGDSITFLFNKENYIESIRFIFDSDLNRKTIGDEIDGKPFLEGKSTPSNIPLNMPALNIPKTLVKDVKIELLIDGEWVETDGIKNNHQRLVIVSVGKTAKAVRFTPTETYGLEKARIYSINIQ